MPGTLPLALKGVLKPGDSMKELEKGIKNGFRWEWLTQTVKVDGADVKLSSCIVKIAKAGTVKCTM